MGELGLYPGAAGDIPPAPMGLLCPEAGYEKFAGSSPLFTASGENIAASPWNPPSLFHIGELLSYGVIAT